MRILLLGVVVSVMTLSSSGCSSSSSAQSGPILQPVIVSGSNIEYLTANDNGDALFWFATSATGSEPWFTTGTGEPAIPLEIVPGAGSSACGSQWGEAQSALITAIGPDFYFWANDGVSGCEVWRSDGTPEGTELFADVIPGAGGFEITGKLVAGGNNLYLYGTVQESGPQINELYVINLE